MSMMIAMNQPKALMKAHVQPSRSSRPNSTRRFATLPEPSARCAICLHPHLRAARRAVRRQVRAYLTVSVPVMFGWTEQLNG